MIYPDSTGKEGEHFRLSTLESVWIQGKLRMWGRWSYIGDGKSGNMFNQLLVTKQPTKTAIREALRLMKRSGINKPELAGYFEEIINGKQKSWLAHCTDAEALKIDGVISEVLAEHPGLIDVLRQRYKGRGMSKLRMAKRLNEMKPEWSLKTCRNRIGAWLNIAEYMLFLPARVAFRHFSDD